MFFTYYTATHFNWWLLAIAVVTCPKWRDIMDWVDVQNEWRRQKKQGEIDKIEKEVRDEQEGN